MVSIKYARVYVACVLEHAQLHLHVLCVNYYPKMNVLVAVVFMSALSVGAQVAWKEIAKSTFVCSKLVNQAN